MKIGIIISHPTQFEGPFFQFAASDKEHSLRVIYANPDKMNQVYDNELSMSLNWGIDLTKGYDYVVMPRKGYMGWLFREIKHEQYDMLIINGYNSLKYLVAAVIAKRLGVKTALRIDSVLFNNRSKLKLLIKRIYFIALFNIYDSFFVVGSLAAEYLKYFKVSTDKIALFTYAVDVDYFRRSASASPAALKAVRKKYGLVEGRQVILSIAKFNDREAPWDLLKAFCEIDTKCCQLLLVGDGPHRAALVSYAKEKGGRVIFTGYVPYPELPLIYAVSDMFVHPPYNEPWGVSVEEAMAAGLPIITSSRVGAGYDLIAEGINGFIYQAGDCEELKRRLLDTLKIAKEGRYRICNDQILAKWDYRATWNNIVKACRKECTL
jgi:glycosyltransferase involved in cell wall biosynthesis